jgi:hypothetical protein
MPFFDTGVDTAPEAAICVIVLAVRGGGRSSTCSCPRTGAPLQPWMPSRCRTWCATSRSCNSRLWADKLGQISLATTTLLWGVVGNLRLHRAGVGGCGPGLRHHAGLQRWPAWWPSASVVGAVVASVIDEAGPRARSVIPLGIGVGLF